MLIFFCGALALLSIVIGIIPFRKKNHGRKFPSLLSFAAGLMLGSVFFHLIPHSVELIDARASYYVLGGFLFLFLIEKFVTVHICEAMDCEVHKLGINAFIGLSIHALADGLAVGSSVNSSYLWLPVFLAIFFHKAQEIFSLNVILAHTQFSRSKVVLLNFIFWLMLPIGIFISRFVLSQVGEEFVGIALAFAAGTFLEICLTDLIPEVHRSYASKKKVFVSFLLGLAFMLALDLLMPH